MQTISNSETVKNETIQDLKNLTLNLYQQEQRRENS